MLNLGRVKQAVTRAQLLRHVSHPPFCRDWLPAPAPLHTAFSFAALVTMRMLMLLVGNVAHSCVAKLSLALRSGYCEHASLIGGHGLGGSFVHKCKDCCQYQSMAQDAPNA